MYLSCLLIDVGDNPDRERPGRRWLRNLYHVHQRLCLAFPSITRKNDDAGFLFRIDTPPGGRAVILVQSAEKPDWEDAFGLRNGAINDQGRPIGNAGYLLAAPPQVKRDNPCFAKGDRLAFKLRANPIQSSKQERTAEELEAWQKSREERGLKPNKSMGKGWTEKVIRHDVVMDAKTRMDLKSIPEEQRPHVATLIQEAGMEWLKSREKENGFSVMQSGTRVDGYCKHRLFKGKNAKPVSFSSLEFDGMLTVTEPDVFVEKCLFNGLGPAKAFGCGLMLVRRA